MSIYSYILTVLYTLHSLKIPTIDTQLHITPDTASLVLDQDNSIDITPEGIRYNENEIGHSIRTKHTQKTNIVQETSVETFFTSIFPSITRINHLGISYSCPDIETEILRCKSYLKNSSLHIYEETSTQPYVRWFFLGNQSNPTAPLFEVVLSQSETPIENEWIPHFQIDLDTTLTDAEIIKETDRYLRPSFVSWKLDIPNQGCVLTMGSLGSIEGTNVTLGIGTNLRRKQWLHEIAE
jgi:hypothetical protein